MDTVGDKKYHYLHQLYAESKKVCKVVQEKV